MRYMFELDDILADCELQWHWNTEQKKCSVGVESEAGLAARCTNQEGGVSVGQAFRMR